MNARFWIAFLSTAAVVAVAAVDLGRTSPGALTTVHGREKLSCADCHGGWFGSMTSACLECHEAIGKQIENSDGLHGALEESRATHCATCHTEHHGESFALVNRGSFVHAGVADRDAFDHNLVGYAMDGKHLKLECSKCHEHADVAVLGKGQVRFLGLDQSCTHCHQDPHEGAMVMKCADCHGQKGWKQLDTLDHSHLPLVGAHAEPSCRDCHANESRHSLEALGSGRAGKARGCAGCHESLHNARFKETCETCHSPEHASFRGDLLVMTPAQHAQTGFTLGAPHDAANCEDCHGAATATFAMRYPGREADVCAHCHEDAHDGVFKNGGRCAECHTETTFHDVPEERFDHLKWTGFAVKGAHRQDECEACHVRTEKPDAAGRTFGRIADFKGCATCHTDPHAGAFETDCGTCHVETSFRAFPDGFDHGRFTGYPLVGGHASIACSKCHEPLRKPDEHGRTWGRARGRKCQDCHADPHARQFITDGRTDCQRCHRSAVGFADLSFNHDRDSRFRLGQQHKDASCDACHKAFKRGGKDVTRYRPMRRRCVDCHGVHKDPLRRRKKTRR